MRVTDFLWLGVNLLLSLSLTTIEVVVDNNSGFGADAALIEGHVLNESGGTVHEVVAVVSDALFNTFSKNKKEIG